jgi:hypothetical protein
MFSFPEIPKSIKDKISGVKERYDAKMESIPEKEREGILSRIKALVSACFGELLGLEKERKETSNKADESVKKTTDEVMADIDGLAKLEDGVEGKPKEAYDETLAAISTAVKENLDDDQKSNFAKGFDKVQDPSKGAMDSDELMATSAVSFIALDAIKAAHPSKAALEDYFTNLQKAAEKSPLSKIFPNDLKQIFKLDKSDGLKILGKFGVGLSMGDLGGAALAAVTGQEADAVFSGEAGDFVETMKGIKEPGVPNIDAISQTMKEKGIITKNIPAVVKAINKLMIEGASPGNLANLVHEIDADDLIHIAALFLGKSDASIKRIKIPDLETVKKAS